MRAGRVHALVSRGRGAGCDCVRTPAADGYAGGIPVGPATMRYVAVIKAGAWRETGDRIVPGKDPVRIFEMNLKRVGDSNWPAGGAIPPK